MKFQLIDPRLPKIPQIGLILLGLICLGIILSSIKVTPYVDWDSVAREKARFAVETEKDLHNLKTNIEVEPSPDFRRMTVKIYIVSPTKRQQKAMNYFGFPSAEPGPIKEFLQAFAIQNYRYSKNLCDLASEKYAGALIEGIAVHYYILPGTTQGGFTDPEFFFSESSSCELLTKIPLWKYIFIALSQTLPKEPRFTFIDVI